MQKKKKKGTEARRRRTCKRVHCRRRLQKTRHWKLIFVQTHGYINLLVAHRPITFVHIFIHRWPS
jgi:hypothetical protein